MKTKIEIKSFLTSSILFESECDGNTILKTLKEAVNKGADLQGADLQGADLGGANLGGKKIKTANVITGLYKYSVIPYFTECGDIRIKMGCCDRLLSEWESNFWNNNIEFPNDNSINSNLRLMAFETAKKWIEIVNQDKSQQ